jgi:antitoxin component of RelBE/YafQ-DinJ toxin-antitoxin module
MTIILNFKTDRKLKDEARKLAADLGLPLGTIMNHYLKEFVREKKVVFTDHPTPTKRVLSELKEISRDIKDGRNLSPTFDNTKDAVKWLNS